MFALSSLPKHRRPVTYREDSRKDFKSLATCLRFAESSSTTDQCHHSACPKHLPNLYADGLAKHVSDVYGTGTF